MTSQATQKSNRKHAAVSEPTWKKWGKLVVIALSIAIILIDTTLLNVSLRNIIQDLNSNFTDIQWVITIYTLTLAAFTITGGRLGDLYGRKRMFMMGAVLFAIGSFIASISHSVGMLLLGESIIEGLGAALMLPAAATLLLTNYEGKDRAIAFAVFGAVAGASSALGPILGGWLTSAYSWRWGFRINIFVVLVLLIGSLLIKESRDTAEKKELDWLGVFLSATGLLSLVFGIIQSSDYGWWLAKDTFKLGGVAFNFAPLSITPVAISIGVILLVVFAWWQGQREKAGHTPLLSMHIFENRQFVSGMAVTTTMSLSLTGLIFVFPIYFQAVHGMDALHTGFALFPLSLTVFLISPAALFIAKKAKPRAIILVGLLLTAAAVLVMILMLKAGSPSNVLLPGLMIFGIGMGLVFSQINNLTLSAIDRQFAGEASGINNTARQVGSSFGAAIIGAALFANISGQIGVKLNAETGIPDSIRGKIVELARNTSKDGGFGEERAPQGIPPEFQASVAKLPAQQQILAIQKYQAEQERIATLVQEDVKIAITEAVRNTLWIALGFTLLSIIVGFGLPNINSLIDGQPVKSKSVVGH